MVKQKKCTRITQSGKTKLRRPECGLHLKAKDLIGRL